MFCILCRNRNINFFVNIVNLKCHVPYIHCPYSTWCWVYIVLYIKTILLISISMVFSRNIYNIFHLTSAALTRPLVLVYFILRVFVVVHLRSVWQTIRTACRACWLLGSLGLLYCVPWFLTPLGDTAYCCYVHRESKIWFSSITDYNLHNKHLMIKQSVPRRYVVENVSIIEKLHEECNDAAISIHRKSSYHSCYKYYKIVTYLVSLQFTVGSNTSHKFLKIVLRFVILLVTVQL